MESDLSAHHSVWLFIFLLSYFNFYRFRMTSQKVLSNLYNLVVILGLNRVFTQTACFLMFLPSAEISVWAGEHIQCSVSWLPCILLSAGTLGFSCSLPVFPSELGMCAEAVKFFYDLLISRICLLNFWLACHWPNSGWTSS